ncbi:type IX secretion system protein PorG [Hymenobacter actinosclerus]|uniref:Outer membrane protein beta-barrel domain-containing protein n=1 Tax=Hymenobacter actinosclerus TaxID=82805 RepID=A0A1I0ICH8_9BACT|nr:DUF6089 family protein [Hymenobacter actinosclerus]SET93832.1 Outer membrane protein beta-barrel domain-containing protein [Hymenobacter actinosclerus]
MIKATSFKTLLIGLGSVGSVFFAQAAQAQNPGAQTTSEIGLGVGGLVYKGELAPHYQFRNNRPALTAFYRRDLTGAVTVRGALTGGMLRADDRNVKGLNGNQPPLSAYRDSHLKGSLLELSGGIEYNFFDYHNREDKVHFTPYVFVGVAGFYANTDVQSNAFPSLDKKASVLSLAVPVGVGFKYALSTHWNLGLEVGARKTFTDDLDHIDGKTRGQTDEIGNPHDQDWYFYNGLSISYTFYKIHCPDKRDDKAKKK